jgi:hypothetical protein
MDFNTLRSLSSGRPLVDVACPTCGPRARSLHNRVRKVLRIWDNGSDFITYACARCDESGYSKDDNTDHMTCRRQEPAKVEPVPDKSDTARFSAKGEEKP